MNNSNTKLILQLILGTLILINLFYFNLPKDSSKNVYEENGRKTISSGKIKFIEKSNTLGIKYSHGRVDNKILSESVVFPSVSVVDINQDGYMDIFIPSPISRKKSQFFINKDGKFFKKEPHNFGVDKISNGRDSFGAFADFNKDGKEDLLLTEWGCHKLLIQKENGSFRDASDLLNSYCSMPDGVNIFDYNNDGYLDLIFGNFLSFPYKKINNELWGTNARYDNKTGGENHLLEGLSDGSFKLREGIDFLTRSYTHAVGINDVNQDGYEDIFFANDYAHDELFINQNGKSFIDKTNDFIPKEHHGFSGMNAEFVDFNQDGLIDLYVTNIFKPPFYRKYNILWQKNTKGTFDVASLKLGNAKCGFSWGAKFADFDNDGDLDLAVVNGRSRGLSNSSSQKSLWYQRINVSFLPTFLRKYYHSNINLKNYHVSAYERSCFFENVNGEFVDIAKEANFADYQEGKGLALIDFDNDGRMDIVTVSHLGEARLYHNVSSSRKWVGFVLINKFGSRIPIGAKVKAYLDNGKTIVREVYPLNGYRAQSDPRVHIGLKKEENIKFVEVIWRKKVIRRYDNLIENSYNQLHEKS